MADTPEHTPEEIEAAREDAELLGDYASLVRDDLQAQADEQRDAVAAGDDDRRITAGIKKNSLLTLLAWVVAIGILIGIVYGLFNVLNTQDTQPSSQPETPATTEPEPAEPPEEAPSADPPAEEEQPAEEAPAPAAAPAHFVGTIVSDNGWFSITVVEDGSASGLLLVSQEVDGGTATQSGTFAGGIDADNVITCAGAYAGVSVDANGNEYEYDGTVAIRAVPTSGDLSSWEITADGDPGEAVTVPAHVQ